MQNSSLPTFVCSLAVAGLAFACFAKPSSAELVDSAMIELNSGDPGQAAALLDRALAGMEPDDPDFVRAQSALAAALAPFEPDLAADRFLAFGRAHPDLTSGDLYRATAEAVHRAGAAVQATSILHAGIERYPEDTALAAAMESMVARSRNDEDLLAHLDGLGYLGGK